MIRSRRKSIFQNSCSPRPFPMRRTLAHVRTYIIVCMDAQTLVAPTRRPRFRRASEPPAFRLTDDDVHIVRQLARHRFLKSTHIAALVGRSLDRATTASCGSITPAISTARARSSTTTPPRLIPIAYALADRGARAIDPTRRRRVRQRRMAQAEPQGRAAIHRAPAWRSVRFLVALQRAARVRATCNSFTRSTSVAAFPGSARAARNPFAPREALAPGSRARDRVSSPTSSSNSNSRTVPAIPLWSRLTAARCPSPAPIFCKRASSEMRAYLTRMPENSTSAPLVENISRAHPDRPLHRGPR